MLIFSQKALRNWIPPMGSVIITDLDECSVDSDHRRSFHDFDGELDIPAWHTDGTPENIALDVLRPWGVRFAELGEERKDCIFGVCTSREFITADYDWVQKHLKVQRNSGMIWHRETGCTESRESLKHRLFVQNIRKDFDLLLAVNNGKMYFFDDKVKNVLEAESLGLIGVLVY